MVIIKERERVRQIEYFYDFDDGDGGGFRFDCDENGKLLFDAESNPAAWHNYQEALAHPERFTVYNEFSHRTWSYTEPAIGRCSCGEEFELYDEYMGACECPKCGRWYNLFGQELLPPDQWEEDY